MLKEKWKELNWLSRVAYILVAITLLSLPIRGYRTKRVGD